MEEKILFIVDSFEPTPSSNGVCVDRLWKESQKIQYSHLLAMTGEPKNERIENRLSVYFYIRKPSSYFNRLFSFAQDSSMVQFLVERASEIIKKNEITTIVCCYRPVEILLVGVLLKKRFPNRLRVISYYLDNLTEVTSLSKWKAFIFRRHQQRLLKKAYKISNCTLALKYYQSTFERVLGKNTHKMKYVGLPGLIESKQEKNVEDRKEEIKLVYTGSFYSGFREPENILKFLKEVCQILPNLKIHLYSWGMDEQIQKAKLELNEQLIIYGRVDAEQARQAIIGADCLLNVGNDLPNQVPGKLLEYFSTGKPIINFVYRDDDPAYEDYMRYENIFLVKNNSNNNPETCAEFIKTARTLSWTTVQSRFENCEPIYTIKKIMEK